MLPNLRFLRSTTTCPLLVSMFALATGGSAMAQESSALFDATVIVAEPWQRIDALFDVDQDGDLDGIGVSSTTSSLRELEVRVLVNDGNGTFPSSLVIHREASVLPGQNALDIAVGDFDGDGQDEFAVVGYPRVLVFESQAGSVVPVEVARATTTNARMIAEARVADVDGDGDEEMVLRMGTTLQVFDLRAGALVPMVEWPGLTAVRDLALIDADGDGADDVLVLEQDQFRLLVRDATSNAWVTAWQWPHALAIPSWVPGHVVAGDIDGDGDRDAVAFAAGTAVILRSRGGTGLVVESGFPGGPATALADVDGDGDLDGICCGGGGGGTQPGNGQLAHFEIAINRDGNGAFAPAFTIPNMGGRHIAGAADIDGDGDCDLIAGRGVYFGRGPIRGSIERVPSSFNPRFPRIFDVDGDFDPDYGVGNGGAVRNRGGGAGPIDRHVMPPVPNPGMYWGGGGYVGDFDADGDVDLVAALVDPTTQRATAMHLLANRGSGAFEDRGLAAAPGTILEPAPAGFVTNNGNDEHVATDLDADGDIDLVVSFVPFSSASERYTASQVWLNDGSGFFSPGQRLERLIAFDSTDLDGDGDVDLLLGSHGTVTATIYVAFGNGVGAFATPVPLGFSQTWGATLSLGDVDGDGDTDIFFDDSPLIRFWINDGTGRGSVVDALPATERVEFVSHRRTLLEDFDGDGRLDLLVHPERWDQASAVFYLQQQDGSFRRHAKLAMMPSTILDVDGDGDRDVLGSHVHRRRIVAGAVRREVGAGTPGSAGAIPRLGESGPLTVGSPTTTIICGGVGGTVGAFAFGARIASPLAPLPGLELHVDPASWVTIGISLGGPAGVPGAGELRLPWVVPPGIAGQTFTKQAFLLDVAAPYGVTQTNALMVGHPR